MAPCKGYVKSISRERLLTNYRCINQENNTTGTNFDELPFYLARFIYLIVFMQSTPVLEVLPSSLSVSFVVHYYKNNTVNNAMQGVPSLNSILSGNKYLAYKGYITLFFAYKQCF